MTTVLFATEYDTANTVAGVLTDSSNGAHVYPLLVRHRPSPYVEFCLQTQKCRDSVRVAPVFVCEDARLGLSRYITAYEPIPVRALSASLREDRTRELYAPLFARESRRAANEAGGRGCHIAAGGDLRTLALFHKNAVIRHLNLTFLTPTSPSWFMGVFGATEGMALLSMSYYLFERQYSTVQTTRDYVRCFCAHTGRPVVAYSTMHDFMRVLLSSPFRAKVAAFAAFAKRRNERDRRELEAVDAEIDRFRRKSRLVSAACVHYVYLAYRTALSKARLLRYCDAAAYDPDEADEDQCRKDPLCLSTHLSESLISVMETYFSPEKFFREYVEYDLLELSAGGDGGDGEDGKDGPRLAGYRFATDAEDTVGFFGPVASLTRTLRRLNANTEGVFCPVEPTVAGALRVCASDRYAETAAREEEGEEGEGRTEGKRRRPRYERLTRRDHLLGAGRTPPPPRGPYPMFRVELSEGRHIFCIVCREAWAASLFGAADPLRHVPGAYVSDEAVTDAFWLQEPHRCATQDYRLQLYHTRHEIFNEALPVYNFVGDLDLKLKEGRPPLTQRLFFDACRGLRRVILALWKNLFRDAVDERTHPVYFFKSACPLDVATPAASSSSSPPFPYAAGAGYEGVSFFEHGVPEAHFCGCTQKLGLRVVAPFPAGTAALGGDTMRTLTRILNHAVCLDRELVDLLDAVSHPEDCFDAGIYRTGRSVRLPYMYKVDRDSGRLMHGRLNPVFVVPAGLRDDPRGFVAMQMELGNLLHHHPGRLAPRGPAAVAAAASPERLLVSIRDKACPDPDVSFIDRRSARVSRYPRSPVSGIIALHLEAAAAAAAGLRGALDANPQTIPGDAFGDDGSDGGSDSSQDSTDGARAKRFKAGDDGDEARDDDEEGEEEEDGGDGRRRRRGRRVRLDEAAVRRFVHGTVWPQILQQITAHCDEATVKQFSEDAIIFDTRNVHCVAVKKLRGGRLRDFRCLTRTHRNPQETVQLFLDLRGGYRNVLWATLWSRCFATKCNSNSKQAHASCKIKPPSPLG